MACLRNEHKNSIVWPRDIADDPASLIFEAMETIIWKLTIVTVVQIVSKFFEMTEAIGMIQTIIWKPGLSGLAVAVNKYDILPSLEQTWFCMSIKYS